MFLVSMVICSYLFIFNFFLSGLFSLAVYCSMNFFFFCVCEAVWIYGNS